MPYFFLYASYIYIYIILKQRKIESNNEPFGQAIIKKKKKNWYHTRSSLKLLLQSMNDIKIFEKVAM